MNVTKDVIQDLVVVYLAGEASADTRRLVEECLAKDPEMAERVKAARAFSIPTAAPPPDLERRALDRTRRLLSRKNNLLGFAMLFTYVPLSFAYSFAGKNVTFVLFRDMPVVAGILLQIGIYGWIVFLYTCWQLRATGLQPAKNWRTLALWALGGIAAGTPIVILLSVWTGWSYAFWLIGVFAGIAVAIGEFIRAYTAPAHR
jgi:hypothetical protein